MTAPLQSNECHILSEWGLVRGTTGVQLHFSKPAANKQNCLPCWQLKCPAWNGRAKSFPMWLGFASWLHVMRFVWPRVRVGALPISGGNCQQDSNSKSRSNGWQRKVDSSTWAFIGSSTCRIDLVGFAIILTARPSEWITPCSNAPGCFSCLPQSTAPSFRARRRSVRDHSSWHLLSNNGTVMGCQATNLQAISEPTNAVQIKRCEHIRSAKADIS